MPTETETAPEAYSEPTGANGSDTPSPQPVQEKVNPWDVAESRVKSNPFDVAESRRAPIISRSEDLSRTLTPLTEIAVARTFSSPRDLSNLPKFEPDQSKVPEEAKQPGYKSFQEENLDIDTPILRLGDSLFPKDTALNPRLGRVSSPGSVKGVVESKLSPVEEGIADTLREAVNSLTTEKNLAYMAATIGVGTTGAVSKNFISAFWAAFMGKGAIDDAPRIGAELGTEMAKPEGERDRKKIASLLTQTGLNTFMAAAPAVHLGGELSKALGAGPATLALPKPVISPDLDALAPLTAKAASEVLKSAPKPIETSPTVPEVAKFTELAQAESPLAPDLAPKPALEPLAGPETPPQVEKPVLEPAKGVETPLEPVTEPKPEKGPESNAVQIESPSSEVLQPPRPEVGLQEVGAGDAKPEEVASARTETPQPEAPVEQGKAEVKALKELGLTDSDISDLKTGKASVSDVVSRKLQPFEGGGGPDHAKALEEARLQAIQQIESVFKPEAKPNEAPQPNLEPSQTELAQGVGAKPTPVQPPETLRSGGPESGGEAKAQEKARVESAASRFRPREKIAFEKPLVGPSKAKLIAYEWKWQPEEYVDKRGEERVRRVSNWEEAESSAETGRDLVHQFVVEMPNGERRLVSSESVPQLLGYSEKSVSKLPGLISATKTLSKLKMKLATVEARLAENDRISGEVSKQTPPIDKISSSKAWNSPESKSQRFEMPSPEGVSERIWQVQHESGPAMQYTIDSLVQQWKALAEKKLGYTHVSESVYDLKRRIERQERKIGAATETAPVDLTAEKKPETVNPAVSPETTTVRSASDRTDERIGSEMTAETGAIPARAETATRKLRKSTQAEQTRPSDILDEIEGGHTKSISLKSARTIQEDFKPKGAARKLFSARGGMAIDKLTDALRRSGQLSENATEGDLLDKISAAAESRKGWRSGVTKENKLVVEEERQHVEFQEDIKKNTQSTDPIVAEDLNVGDRFSLRGAKFKVSKLEFDEHGDVTSVELDDGQKYGTQTVEGKTRLRMDKESLVKKAPKPIGELFSPEETPFNLAGEKAEMVEPKTETTQHGTETLAQDELFGIQKVVESKDPSKSADAAQQMYGGSKEAISKLENQLRVVDSDPKVSKSFTNEQRGRLKEVISLLRERSKAEPKPNPFDQAQAKNKYRIGNNPQPYSLIEKLAQSEAEKSSGEQPVRVRNDKTGKEETVLESDLSPIKERTPEEREASKPTSSKELDDELRRVGMDPSVFPDAKSKREALKRKKALDLAGPGSPSIEQGSDPKAAIDALEESFRNIKGPKPSLGEQVKEAFSVGDKLSQAKDSVSTALQGLKSAGDYIIKKWEGIPTVDEMLKAKGELSAELEKRGWRVRQFVKTVEEAMPTKRQRAAILKWVDAGGDELELKRGLKETPDQFKPAYDDALKLKGDDLIAARNIQSYFEERLDDAIESGVLQEGIEDYIHRIYERNPKLEKQALAYVQSGLLKQDPGLTKKRVFQFDWEAEKAGLKPVQDFLPRIAQYEASLSRAIAARKFVREMTGHENEGKRVPGMKAEDGRPVLDVAGLGVPIEDATGAREGTLIKPSFKPGDETNALNNRRDYVEKDYPALRKWKWVTADSEGNPIFVQGNLLIHPDFVGRIDALLEPSKVKYGRYPRLGKGLLGVSSTMKQTMLDLSGFHQVQIAVHGLEHKVLPWKIVKDIDLENPSVDGLLKGGITLGGEYYADHASEGLIGSSLSRHVPMLGPLLESYHSWLFQSFIPRIKMTMALNALERNRGRYSGTMTDEQIFHKTASEANSAFGELNYTMLERSKTVRDLSRLIMLAPDFLEARGRFAGGALEKGGKLAGQEQRAALLLGALTMYVTARIANKIVDDKYHFEPENAFSVVHNGQAYSLRTVQGDIMHLIEKPISFWIHRLNPVFGRTALEIASGRDEFGRKRSVPEALWDTASNLTPISLRSGRERTLWESLLNSMGVTDRRWNDVDKAFDLAKDWKKDHGVQEKGEFIYDRDKDPLRGLKIALSRGDEGRAAKEIKNLLESKTITRDKLNKYFERYSSMAFTGSRANDAKFLKTLTEDQLKIVEGAKQHKKSIRELYLKARNQYEASRSS